MLRAGLFPVLLFCFAHVAQAATLDVAMPPKEGEKFKSAEFRIWLPENVKTIRALIIRQHGCGRNGIDHADDLQWQALARKHDAAIVSSWFVQDKECKDWFDPANGSERALFDALKHFAEKSRHPELVTAPWAIWGHSGGSMWACHMTNRHPDRTIAIWARSQALTEYTEKALLVPIVFNYGEGEKTGRFEAVHKNSQAAFSTYAPKGAVWAVAVDPKSSHDCRNSRQLAIPFFDKILAARLPKEGTELRAVPRFDWVGDPETFAIYNNTRRRGEVLPQCWLIDEEFAKQWQEYCKTGEVKDTSKPAAPTIRVVSVSDKGVSLKWDAEADLQSGAKLFIVYKNGAKLAEVGGEKTKGNPNGFVQIANYGDEPEPRSPVFAFVDEAGKVGDSYQITLLNHAGLESEKSAAATTK